MAQTRGFITIATGKDEYYILARNLLVSYKFHTRDPLPFAILCDRENAVTREFDDVVIIDAPTRSYTDKLRILDLSPYDENIFIDADSLAYSDLNGLWEFFKDSPPFGLLGEVLPIGSDKAWISIENAGVFKDRLENLMICQGGIYYVRKDGLKDFRDTVDYILRHYAEFKFRLFYFRPSDEAVFTLACTVHRYHPVYQWPEVFCYYPDVERIYKLDIRSGVMDYVFKWQNGCDPFDVGKLLLHWGTEHTRDWLYFRETERLRSASAGRRFNPVRPAFLYVKTHLKQAIRSLLPYRSKVFFHNLLHPPKPEGK